MLEISKEFKVFCNDLGFFIEDFQLEIVDIIFNNCINNKRKLQIVLLPKGAGKTALILLLSYFLQIKNRSSAIYSCFDVRSTVPSYSIFNRIIKRLKEDIFFNPLTVLDLNISDLDTIIVDGLLESRMVDTESEKMNSLIGLYKNNTNEFINNISSEDLQKIGYRDLCNKYNNGEFNLIIFDTRENFELYKDNQFIRKNFPFVLDYFPDLSKYTSNYEMKLREKVADNSEKNIYELYIKEYFEQKFSEVNNKLDSINDEILQIREISKQIQSEVNSKKYTIQAFKEFSDDERNIDDFTECIVGKLTSRINEEIKSFEKLNSYKQYKKLIEIRMGKDAWNKLSEESKRFLTTAKFTFSENMLIGEEVDYSSVCLLVSKTFEIELSKRLVTGYEEYLESVLGENYHSWPSAIIKQNRFGKLYPMSIEEFTLGSCAYIMGSLPKYGNEAKENRKSFKKYCEDRLLIDNSNIDEFIETLNEQVRKVKDYYRNPAAHKDSINMLEASECIDYILEVERVLKRILNRFNF